MHVICTYLCTYICYINGFRELTYSVEVSLVKRWFDKWRAHLRLQVLTKTADKRYTSVLLKKTYYCLTNLATITMDSSIYMLYGGIHCEEGYTVYI